MQQNNWDFETWIEYDANDNLHSFVHPETGKYVTPQSQDWSVYMLSDLGPDGRPINGEFKWTNGGKSATITHTPDGKPISELSDIYEMQTVNYQGEQVLAIVFPDNKTTTHIYQNGEWVETRIFYIEQISC